MSFIVRVYYGEQIFSIDLSVKDNPAIGSDFSDTIVLEAHGLGKSEIVFGKSSEGDTITSHQAFWHDGSLMNFDLLCAGKTYMIDTEPRISISIHPKQEDSQRIVKLVGLREVNIGRGPANDIALCNMRTSSRHCVICEDGKGYKIRDLHSTNGTFVNGKKIEESMLMNNDVINIGIYQLVFMDGALSFYNTGNDMTLRVASEDRYKPVEQPVDKISQEVRRTGTKRAVLWERDEQETELSMQESKEQEQNQELESLKRRNGTRSVF